MEEAAEAEPSEWRAEHERVRPGVESLFLWGPRQTGKSTLLRRKYSGGRWIDPLKPDEFRRYVSRPELLRQEVDAERPVPARRLFEHCARVRRIDPHEKEPLSDSGGYVAREMAARVSEATQAARDRLARVRPVSSIAEESSAPRCARSHGPRSERSDRGGCRAARGERRSSRSARRGVGTGSGAQLTCPHASYQVLCGSVPAQDFLIAA